MTSMQRLISNLDNRVVDADITADDVAPAEHAAFPEPLERDGLGDVEISGAYTGAEDATLEIEVTSDTAGSDRRTTEPEFVGVGNGSLEGLTASGAAAQSYTVSLIDTGTDTEAAEFPIEGVKLVAATAGVVGNLLELQVDAGALTYTSTGATTVDSADAGSDTFASDAWSLGGFPLIAGRLDPATPRVAFGDDPTIYRPYRERRDGRWIYRLTPALENDVPKGAQIYVVTGSRVVTLTDGTDDEVYTGVVTAWDLLGQIQAGSDLAVIDGTASNDRTPGGMASRELGLVTRARVTRVEPVGTRYVTDLVGLAPAPAARSQTVAIECTAADSVGKERWAVVGTADGDIGAATTGSEFTSDVLDFTIPKKVPIGGEGLRFDHVATRYVAEDVDDRAPICLDQMFTGAKARSRTLTLTYEKRPGAGCDCDSTDFTGSVDASLLGLADLGESGTTGGGETTFDRSSYDTAYQAALDDLSAATPGSTVYTVTHKAVTDVGTEAVAEDYNFGTGAQLTRVASSTQFLMTRVGNLEIGLWIQVWQRTGGTWSLFGEIKSDDFADLTGDVLSSRILNVGGSPVVFARVTLDATGEHWQARFEDSSGWSKTDLWNNTTTGEGIGAVSADGTLILATQSRNIRSGTDGTIHSTLPDDGVTQTIPITMSGDATRFASILRDDAGTDEVRIYSRSGTSYTAEHTATVDNTGALGEFDDSGAVFWCYARGVVLKRTGTTWADYYTLPFSPHSDSVQVSADGGRLITIDPNVTPGDPEVVTVLDDNGSAFATYDSFTVSAFATWRDFRGGADGTFVAGEHSYDGAGGANSGRILVFDDSGSEYSQVQQLDVATVGPLLALFGRAESSGTTFERGWVAEFTDETAAGDWRDALRALGTAEADGDKWRARINLTSTYADDLDPTDIGLTTSSPYYLGYDDAGTLRPYLYDTEADAEAAITALADTLIQETGRTDDYDRAEPVVDYKAAYDPFDDYIAALGEIYAFLDDVVRVPDLEDEFLAAWTPALDDKDDVIAETIDGRDPAIRDRYVDAILAFEAERANFGVAWEDTGADFWWVFTQDSGADLINYLPAFTNVVYHSATRNNGGFPYSTQEFAFVIKVECTNKLQEGDQIILNLDTGDSAYVTGDRWEVDLVAGASGQFFGGVDGDNTLTWDVRGSSSGALGTYAVEDGSETAYDDNGLEFTIYRGQIPFSAGDRFTFSVEGGAWRWRFDDDDWTDATGFQDAATELANGLSARFVAGSAPSFVAGDQYRWAIEQPAAPSHAADSFDAVWTFSAASAVWTATWGTAVDVAVVLIARHSLPGGSTVTVAGSASAEEQFSETLTVGAGGLVLVLDDTATIDALQVSPSAEGGSIGWIFAGDPPGIGGDADVSMQPSWAMIRSGLNGAVARGRQDNAELRWDYLTAEEAEHLAAIFDHSKSAGDQPLAYVPSLASDQPKLRLVRFAADDLALPDLYAWTDDDPVLRDVTVSLAGVLL